MFFHENFCLFIILGFHFYETQCILQKAFESKYRTSEIIPRCLEITANILKIFGIKTRSR